MDSEASSKEKWLVVAGAFIVTLGYGSVSSYGVFLVPMQKDQGWDIATTSLAFSIQSGMYLPSAILVGAISDRYGPRKAILLGGLLMGSGITAAAGATSPIILYVTFGVLTGLGSGSVYIPTMATVMGWFGRKRGFAIGLANSGFSLGAVIFAPLAEKIISQSGWRWAFVALGAVFLVAAVTSSMLIKKNPMIQSNDRFPTTVNNSSWRPKEAARSLTFLLMVPIYIFVTTTATMLQTHLPTYSEAELGFSGPASAMALGILGGSTFIGRVGLGALSDKIGRKPTFVLGYSQLAVALILLAVAKNLWELYLASALIGMGAGGIFVLYSSAVGHLFGLAFIGTIWGILDGVSWAIGGVLGPALGGYAFEATQSYFGVIILMAVLSMLGAVISTALKPPKKSRPI